MTQLIVGRWANSLSSPGLKETIYNAESIGFRWSLSNHGLARMEIVVKAKNEIDMYSRTRNHLGQRMGIYDSGLHSTLTGFISQVEPVDSWRVRYIIKGPSWRMEDDLDTTVYANTNDLQTTIQTICTDHISVADSDQTNIAANTTTLGGWQTKWPEGSTPKEAIGQLLEKSDSSGNIYDFWLQDRPLSRDTLQLWLPYYVARSTSASIDWRVYRRDLSKLTLSRDINELATSVTVYYGTITGTHDGGNNSSTLVDSGANFVTSGVVAGDHVTNETDRSRAKVETVAATTLTLSGLSGGTDNDFDTNDAYSIQMQTPKSVTSAGTVTATYWDVDLSDFKKEMDATQAAQYRDLLVNTSAKQVQAFTITSPFIKSGNGSRFPLWQVAMRGGGYIQIADLYPDAAILDLSSDDLTTFFITALDYDYTSNSLRVNVDRPDRRLDARLRAAGILESEMVNRGQSAF